MSQKKDRPAANRTGPNRYLDTAKSAINPDNGKPLGRGVSQQLSWPAADYAYLLDGVR
jgi:hypothetical protein